MSCSRGCIMSCSQCRVIQDAAFFLPQISLWKDTSPAGFQPAQTENLFTLSHPSPCQLQAHLLPGEHSLQQAGYHQASLYLKELKMNCRRTSKVLSFSKSFQCIMDFLPLYQHCKMLCHSTRILFMECCAGRTKVNHLHHFLVWQDSYVSVSV